MLDHEIWLVKASSDLRSSKILFESKVLDTCVFHTQQCAEKSLKAFLSYKGSIIKRTHNLEYLLKLCCVYDKEFECLMNYAIALNPYCFKFRYPDDLFEPEIEDASQALFMAQNILYFSKNKINDLIHGQKNIF